MRYNQTRQSSLVEMMVKTSEPKNLLLSKPGMSQTSKQWIIGVSILGLMVAGGTAIYSLRLINRQPVPVTPTVSETPKILAVTALGRLEPRGEVIKIAAPPNMGGAKVTELLIEEGDFVKAGQRIAILDNYERKQAALALAEKEVRVAQANLEIVKAGAKQGEILAQKAEIQRLEAELTGEINTNKVTIARLQTELAGEQEEQQATVERLEAELKDAQRDYQRYQSLAQEGVIATADLDQRVLNLETAQERLVEAKAKLKKTVNTLDKEIRETKALANKRVDTLYQEINQARANLEKIAEVRTVDIDKAQAEVERAQAALKEAKADLYLGYVSAPSSGQILKIHAYPGEMVNNDDGIAEIGNTQQMMVIAEVYESDIKQVRIGQRATVVSENSTFPGKLTGKVEQIGLKIGKKDVLDTDPAADVDVRVIEVKIALDAAASQQVAGLTYGKVIANIQVE